MYREDELKLQKYLFGAFPKVSLVISMSRSDKNDFVEKVSNSVNMEVFDITEDISNEYLNDLYALITPYVYVIDLDKLSINKQNMILKFIEDSPSQSYILLLVSMKSTVIPTINTRCVEFQLHNYTKKDLIDYAKGLNIENDLLISVSQTLDDIDNYRNCDLMPLQNLCDSIGLNISKATLPNTLSIPHKYLYFKDKEPGKYDLDIFVRMLKQSFYKLFRNTKSKVVYDLYKETVSFTDKLNITSVSKEMLCDNLMIKLWVISRGNNEH